MASNGLFAEVAALAGDPGRASMLHALMDGRALTATELTKVAGITPQTASGHLNRMISTYRQRAITSLRASAMIMTLDTQRFDDPTKMV
jgi:DNA-binding transcriptional ArsR family regulator